MNKKTVFTWLVLVMIVVSGCGGGSATPSETEETPSTPTPTPEVNVAAKIDSDLQRILAYSFPSPNESSAWTIPIKVAPYFKFAEYAYTIPDWWSNESTSVPYEVGVVEIGNGPDFQGQYVLSIDLVSSQDVVSGFIASTTDADIYAVPFQRIPQIVNPLRGDQATYDAFKTPETPPDISVAISADGVCFVVNLPEGLNEKYVGFNRYCSQPGSILSVKNNFEAQYGSLQNQINKIVQGSDLENNIQTDQIISEMEDTSHLEDCATQLLNSATVIQATQAPAVEIPESIESPAPIAPAIPMTEKPSLAWEPATPPAGDTLIATQQKCGSDISLAPVTDAYFKEKYASLSTPGGNRFIMASLLKPTFQPINASIPVAVVLIHQRIDTSLGPVFPGEYTLNYWYDANGNFYAATITGVLTDNGGTVTDQQVPAIPATFVNEDNSEQPGAQISACRIFGICTFFQRSCS